MHLARSLVLLALAFGNVCCTAVDKAEPTAPADKSVNAAAGPGVAVGLLGEFITSLLPSFISLFNEKEGKCKFVQQLTAEVYLKYRDLNVIVYSNLKSDDSGLVGEVCFSVDKQLAFFREQEYRVCVFETGKFVLAGENKCENWHYRGCTERADGKTVSFCRRDPGAQTTATTRPTTTSTKASTTTRPSTTSTKASTKKTSTTSSRPKSTTTSARPTTPSQPGGGDPGTVATSTSAPPPPPPPPTTPPTSAGGNANTGAATTSGQRSAGSTDEPTMFRVLAAAVVAFMAMA